MPSLRPLRLLIYDRTSTTGPGLRPILTPAWAVGSVLYGAIGHRFDAVRSAAGWPEALTWLATVEPGRPIAEIQVWSHGRFGRVLLDRDSLDEDALAPGGRHHDALVAVRARLVGSEALVWFRCCETFGGPEGHRFAEGLATFLGCRVAGHTHTIDVFQSGLHAVRPGQRATWSVDEGVIAHADPRRPRIGQASGPRRPRTLFFLRSNLPAWADG